MPNLDFYAVGEDRADVVAAAFALGLFRVFESYSEPDHELREFHTAEECHDGWLALYVTGAGPEPLNRRIGLNPGALGDATFRYVCEGWGLIHLRFGPLQEHDLAWSNTNHNTQKYARAWFGTTPRLGDPDDWNWPAVTSASGKFNRVIRRMAVDKIGPRPVLPQAQQAIAGAGLLHEYGVGIHADRRGRR